MSELEKVEGEMAALKAHASSAAVREKCDRLVAESRSMRGAR
jgi:hypothetical protein